MKEYTVRVTCPAHGESLLKVQCPACERQTVLGSVGPDLERRIIALEQRFGRSGMQESGLEPEMGRVWKAVDGLFEKAFRWTR
jgi:hypothetical protein